MAAESDAKKVLYAALAGNCVITVTKFIAASFTGSSAMFSEGVHSLVDSGNELLLLYGMRRSKTPRDRAHPLGYGREMYFWSFIVALLVFEFGAGVSLYQGLMQVRNPRALESPVLAYVVLALCFAFEGGSWWIALKEFRASKGDQGYVEAVTKSKDPGTFTVLVEDSAALVGVLIAFCGIFSAHLFDRPELDGFASIGISVVLAITAIFLARESKALLIGESAYPHVQAAVLKIAAEDPAIANANGVLTIQLAPDQVVAALSAEFEDHLTTPQIEACVNRIEARIKAAHPDITLLFVKPQTQKTWRQRTQQIDEESAGG
jgi:cation diffusion facilitator family transporter